MKNIKQILCLTLLTVFVMTGSLRAEKVKGVVRSSSSPKAESATCLPASSSNELTVNNVRAYIETGGTMWFKEVAEYEVPKGSGKTSMFCAALWIGGRDANGQLKLAAVRFRQVGDDFWTGPLKLTGAGTTQSMCIKFDKHFKITRAEVDEHISSYNTSGYVMPASIANWPAHGDEGYSYYLAPFKDVNGNGEYDPENGDYPYYDVNNDLCPWTEDNIALAAQHALPRTPEDLLYYGDDWHNSNGMIYADHVLKGDETLFWIFNDNAGAHTESQGQPIGLEIRGQAFGFATNDELNNMTFYSYEIINRSTYTLTNTYFSQWVDPDLGYANDDYVGCDVARGLGYCYNGSNVDGSGQNWAYGDQPPAVGVDFFQGPYMDPDGRDNPKFYADSAVFSGYCDRFLKSAYELDQMAINGVNIGDSIVDNERFGMRRFVYHNNNSSVTGDPSVAYEYYNMLQGIWKDNSKMKYGENAHSSNGADGPDCDFMFPALTDVCNWGTQGVEVNHAYFGHGNDDGWTEANVGNAPYDRRFMQSAGPFTLKPGSVNYITVGIPWARAAQGGAQASVELLKRADDKCQSLFENCFKTLDGPDAPDVTIRELENELILYISNNDPQKNNYHETYVELDPQIPRTLETSKLVERIDSINAILPDGTDTLIITHSYETVTTIDTLTQDQRSYKFEGYQIYQLANASVSVTDLGDANKALLVAQCDIQNGVGQLINWIYNDALGTSVATEMVKGADNGIKHSFRITEDKFATGTNKVLVNHKEYYFLVLAYGYNEYKHFSLNADNLDGQPTTYLAGRRNIKVTVGTPHKPVETLLNSKYGDVPMITRIEGQGNGGLFLDLTDESRDLILANNVYNNVQYKNNYGPLDIQVIDPLKVKPWDYTVKFLENSISEDVNDSTMWQLVISDEVSDEELIENGIVNRDGTPARSTTAAMPISMTNEQLFLELGISVSIKNATFRIHQKNLDEYVQEHGGYTYANLTYYAQPEALGSDISYTGENPWLSGVYDGDGDYPNNWIRSGQQTAASKWECNSVQEGAECDYMKWRAEDYFNLFTAATSQSSEITRGFMDPDQQFESFVDGTWAPYIMTSAYDGGPKARFLVEDVVSGENSPTPSYFDFTSLIGVANMAGYNQTLTNLYSVDIVLTSDKSKWTRAVVLESGSAGLDDNYVVTQNFNGQTYQNIRHEPKTCPSVDKDGNPDNSGTTGMGWFPGYAINVETGERLNIMFAENSEDTLNNGNDMIFNPTNVYAYYKDNDGELMTDENGEYMPMSISMYNAYRDSYGIEFGEPLSGGRHYVYVLGSSGNTANTYYRFNNRTRNYNDGYQTVTGQGGVSHGNTFTGADGNTYPYYECGPYDECRWVAQKFSTLTETNYNTGSRKVKKMEIFNNVMWTSIPMPTTMLEDKWLSSDATVKLRVSRPYLRYSSRWYDDPSQSANASLNNGYPMYSFTTKNIAPEKVEQVSDIENLLQEINIIPNPYYGYSNYEHTALENFVRIVNIPAKCTISIYTVNGTLIRTLTHGSAEDSYVQWDLKNHANIPIASGVYIIHVNAPGIGERTLKFFCNMRPTDLNGF